MKTFLDGVDAAQTPIPRERRCLAALAPKMLALSAERSLGVDSVLHARSSTRAVARAQLGAGPLVAPEVAFVLDTDSERARATAREYAQLYLGATQLHEQPAHAGIQRGGHLGRRLRPA